MPVTFHVYGQKVEINDRYVLYNEIRRKYAQLAKEAAEKFMEAYDDYGDIETFAKDGYGDGTKIIIGVAEANVINPLVQEHGVLHIDIDLFIRTYYHSHFVWETYSDKIIDKYMEIKLDQEQLDEYRTQRRESRGRVIGGGFGVGGAVQGMMTAGAVNMAAGAVHGAFNLIGKGFSMLGESFEKSRLYSSEETKNTLYTGIYQSVFNMHFAHWKVFNDLNLIPVKDGIIQYLSESERENAKSVLKNLPKMTAEKAASLVPGILLQNPYDLHTYQSMLQFLGDSANELEQVGNYFGNDIVHVKRDMLEDVFEKYSPEVTDTEEEVLQAREAYFGEYKKLGGGKDGEKRLEEIDAMLAEIDLEARTVDSFVFDTREEADQAKRHLSIVHKALEDIDYKKSEDQAKMAFARLSKHDQSSPIILKYLEDIQAKLTAFDIEARTSNNILFDTRGEKNAADTVFTTLAKIKKMNGINDENIFGVIRSATSLTLLKSAQHNIFLTQFVDDLLESNDERLALQTKDFIAAAEVTPETRKAMDTLKKLVAKKLISIDTGLRSVVCHDNTFVFETREEAAVVREEAERLEDAYTKFTKSPEEKKLFSELLEKTNHQGVKDTYASLSDTFLQEQEKIVAESEGLMDHIGGIALGAAFTFIPLYFMLKSWSTWSWFGKKTIVGFLFLSGIFGMYDQTMTLIKTRKAMKYHADK
ncbi:hypothetical protein LJC40_01690 [Synergistaceae bacterium OttesenSCG-928-D05]|nr:hypothetical protein [Synergistaceae bacterium OttesenSCG-928-D05]